MNEGMNKENKLWMNEGMNKENKQWMNEGIQHSHLTVTKILKHI